MHHGIGASKGIGIGNVVILQETKLEYHVPNSIDPDKELARFQDAVAKFSKITTKLYEDIKSRVGEAEAMILQGQIFMISDPMLTTEIETLIKSNHCAEEAVTKICDQFIGVFSAIEDEMMRQRATDIGDIKTRLLKILLNVEDIDISQVPKDTVIVVKDLTPSMTAGIVKENIAGIITEVGGKTSHSAILARALLIPAVLSIDGITAKLKNGVQVIVDGNEGIVIEEPSQEELSKYQALSEQGQVERDALKQYIGKRTETADGHRVELFSNIGNVKDVTQVLEGDGEGIGLFRTEFLFMDKKEMPSEEEQYQAYKAVLEQMKSKAVIIRTLDVGGDKEIPYLGLEKEENPFLGYRAIRYCLDRKENYKIQLRALLRAGVHGNLKIMIPLVTCIDEIREVKQLIQNCEQELSKEGVAYQANVPVGVMIETPAACQIADLLAREVDFFSIGTNDLTQYTMAVDRGNSKVAYLYSVFQPAVIRSICHIIACAKAEKIMVGMCGEAAADPKLVPLLLAFGLDEFSVSPASVLGVRQIIGSLKLSDTKVLAEKVLKAATEAEVKEILGFK